MALSQQDQQTVQAWMNQKGVNPNCPGCGQNNWAIGDKIAAPVMQGGAVAIGGPSVPVVQVICGNCAYVNHFAAVPIGV